MKLHVYLNFQGQAEEAVLFYADALGAPAPIILKYSDLPPNPNFPMTDDMKNLILHTELQVGDSTIKISDTPPGMEYSKGNNVSVTLTFENDEEITNVYNKLSVDGKDLVPFGKTDWAEKYANFIDKFGIHWQLNFHGANVFGR